MLGGTWRTGSRSFVIEKRIHGSVFHGRARVEETAVRLEREATHASLLCGGALARPPFLFFDLETTGLNGGAGTYAFLVGCGRFASDGSFITRQHLLTDVRDERPMLEAVAEDLSDAGALVSFNGKSFDAPVLETRYLLHRLEWPVQSLPHVDVLHAARRFWAAPPGRGRLPVDSASPERVESCSLAALEHHLLGAGRLNDVPGFEAPARYFRFVHSADAKPLVGVLEHNRLDLLSLAGLTARLLHLLATGPAATTNAREALALGRLYAAAWTNRARESFERAVVMAGDTDVKASALRCLALTERRARKYEEAARRWHQLLELRGCPAHLAREAAEALAIHHEHRSRDLTAAKNFALKSGRPGKPALEDDAVRHRLARLERKTKKASSSKSQGLCLEPETLPFDLRSRS